MVKTVCEAAETAPRLELLGPLIRELRHRMADKKSTVRAVARLELCTLYRKHVATCLTGNPLDEVEVPADLEWVPKAVLQIFGSEFRRDFDSRNELEAHLATKLLPAESAIRLQALCVMHRSLEPQQQVAFKCLLRLKRSSQRQVTRWVELHRQIKENKDKKADTVVKKAKEELQALVVDMCKDFPESARAQEIWEQLGQCKDQHVARCLLLLASPRSSYNELTTAQDELRRRMSTRLSAPQLLTLQTIASRPAMSLLWRDGADILLSRVAQDVQFGVGDFTHGHPILALMHDFVAIFPEVVSQAGGALALSQALTNAQAGGAPQLPVFRQLLRIVHVVGPQLEEVRASRQKRYVYPSLHRACM